jgi:group I intron endonuclease
MLKELKFISGIYLWYNNSTHDYYIGSAQDLSNRLARYYRPSELVRSKESLIHKALLGYGHAQFTIYILETCESKDLILREQYYFDLFSPLYNLLKFAASSKGYKHTEQTRKLMSQSKIQDPELINRIIALAKINTGKKHSEEFKQFRSEQMKGHNNPNFGKGNAIVEWDLFDKKETLYSSVSHTAKAHSTSRNQIRYCIKNNTFYKSRYYFKYMNQ